MIKWICWIESQQTFETSAFSEIPKRGDILSAIDGAIRVYAMWLLIGPTDTLVIQYEKLYKTPERRAITEKNFLKLHLEKS